MSQEELARRSFLLGVDWVLKLLAANPNALNADPLTAMIIRYRAEQFIASTQPINLWP